MPLSLSLEDGPQQFVVFQQPIHGPHPWLPQLSHFFGKQRLPQARLLMSHANHDTKTIQNRIWLFWFDFVGPIPIFPSANGAVLHREVARANIGRNRSGLSRRRGAELDGESVPLELARAAR